MSQAKFLKFTYNNGSKKINAYLNMPSPIFAVLQREIALCLFEERKEPRCDLRIFWIDEDHDEIEIINQCDYEIFTTKCSIRQHLQVTPLNIESPQIESKITNIKYEIPENDSAAFVIHDHVECDGCNIEPIIGFRYKCIQCNNYDLCQHCEAKHVHPDHMMVRMPSNDCPSVIDAFVTGRSNRRFRRGKSAYAGNTTGFCGTVPHYPQENNTSADINSTQTESKDQHHQHHHHHHGRKHHRRHVRHGLLSHLYDMMQDLAEGGTSNKNEDNLENCSEGETATAGAVAAGSVAGAAAATIANETTRVAQTTAEVAPKKIAQDVLTASPIAKTDFESTTTTEKTNEQIPTVIDDKKNDDNSNTTTYPESKTFNNSNNNNCNANTTPILNTPSFENLTQFVDPQYMKAGIKILNNFSEMFAKMLDPADGGGAAFPMYSNDYQKSLQRKNSDSSTASSNINSATTPTKNVASEKLFGNDNLESTNNDEKLDVASSDTITAILASIGSSPPLPSSTSSANETQNRRSLSEESDWQMIEKNTANTNFDNELLAKATAEAMSSTGVNFETLNKMLKAHIDEEEQRNKEMKDIENKDCDSIASVLDGKTVENINLNNFENGVTVSATASTVSTSATVSSNSSRNMATSTTNTITNMATSTSAAPITTSTQTNTGDDKPTAATVYHNDPRINQAVVAMMAMGFSNEGAWLTQLLESVNGNIMEALDLMTAAQNN